MKPVIKGKNLDVTPALREYIEHKLGKIDRYSSHIHETEVELSVNRNPSVQNSQIVEVTISANGAIIRSEEAAPDMYAAIDLVKDKIERLLRKYEERRMQTHRSGRLKTSVALAQVAEQEEARAETEAHEEHEPVAAVEAVIVTTIQRRKQFKILAMHPDEAVHQMELLGHSFFLFRNDTSNNQLSVVYNRQDGTHGLIEPQL